MAQGSDGWRLVFAHRVRRSDLKHGSHARLRQRRSAFPHSRYCVAAAARLPSCSAPPSGAAAEVLPRRSARRASRRRRTPRRSQEWDIDLTPDLLLNLFSSPGDPTPNVRAQNINTIDEVPDSSWFTNRIYAQPVSLDEIAKRPEHDRRSRAGTVDRDRAQERRRGARVHGARRKGRGLVPQLRRDATIRSRRPPPSRSPTRLFWALGYNQVENYLTTLRRKTSSSTNRRRSARTASGAVSQRATSTTCSTRAAKSADGVYRAIAGRARAGPAARRLPLLRHPPRRSQRHRPARASPRAARAAGVRRLDESRGHEGRQHARHADHRERPRHRAALSAGRRIDVRHRRAGAARRRRRLRVPVRGRPTVEAPRSRSASTSSRGRRSTTRSTRRSASSKATSSSPRRGSRASRSRRFAMRAPTICSGRRCGSWRSPTR